MARPPIDLRQRIKDILTHVDPLPREAETPLPHYRRSGIDMWNLLATSSATSAGSRYRRLCSSATSRGSTRCCS